MTRTIARLAIALAWLASLLAAAAAQGARIKDLADLEGVRENQLLGYGLVIGLNGTGDDVKKSLFTRQSIVNMVERLGISIDAKDVSKLKTKNVAAVMVTAELPPFARPGSTLDVTVSSLGDASSLAVAVTLTTRTLPDTSGGLTAPMVSSGTWISHAVL